ncbi:helix-turn-helix domain-containing protein [Salmonella enterica]|uniref:helix-turn-helix domain-containing protein n=1 Tax=Salmonella enterica TaxID=28901 RepID=UPI001278E671|nr:helix-turn-helix domain-containing protein [Salmonella enterica]ECD7243441.1 helix-turn-helix domain-containing protein [Salmonella enterica subsp. enterica serovar Florida]ECF4166524.1 helix-turn-helix domain-containing protein [Salmonella enterica subsp. enterica serovar Florida]ECW2474269.1 hypothetical protein [Salmonella enterica subsp. enterica serovar Florida]EIQ6926153.1 helix-turn-helix domain-containing protein [Salmonella enterica]EJS1431965.1 helix-turn-helix domain-containing p
MESKYFLLANTHTKTIQGIPFEVIELDRGSLQEMSAELNELNALIKTTTVSLQKISPPELLTAMQGIGRISSKLSGCLAEIQPSATTTAEPLIAATRTQLYAPYDGGMTIAFRIQIARENLGLSEADLARQLGTYSDHISDWERGITEPPASMVIPLANALKCDPLWLLGYSESNVPVKVMQHVDVSTIGKRIGVARVENHMNTQELEEMIGAPDGTVFRWETGKAIPSSQYIDNLAKALNTSVTWLLTGKVTHQDLSGVGKQQHLPASQRADVLSHEAPQR